MKLLSQVVKSVLAGRQKSAPGSPAVQSWLRGGDVDEAGSSRLRAPYLQSPWIYTAVSILAETVAQIPFRISRGRGKSRVLVREGAVYDLFQNPHPLMSRALFWQTVVSWDALRGEFFVAALDERGRPVPMRGRFGAKPVHLLPLNPDYFSYIVNNHELVGWKYLEMSPYAPLESRVLLPEEVVFARNFNPYNFRRGMSPLGVAALAAQGDYAAAQFMKGLMENNGDAGLIVTTEEPLDDVQREQLLTALDRRKRCGMADRPLILWGKTKVERAPILEADLQFLENRKLSRQEIGAIFKVPDSMMGFSGQKNMLSGGSAIEQDRLNFVESTISGLCRRLETAMEEIVKCFDPALSGWFDLDALPVMQAARRDRILTAQKAFSMGVPLNDLNLVYDLGFESFAWGNKAYVDSSLREVGEKGTESKKTEAVERLLEIVDSMSDEDVKANVGKLKKFFFEQRGRVLEAVDEGKDLDWTEEDQILLERMGEERADFWKSVNKMTREAVAAAMDGGEKGMVLERVKGVFNRLSINLQHLKFPQTNK